MTDLIVQAVPYTVTGSQGYDNVYVSLQGTLIINAPLTVGTLLSIDTLGLVQVQTVGGYIIVGGNVTPPPTPPPPTGSFGIVGLYDMSGSQLGGLIIENVQETFEYKRAILAIPVGNRDVIQGLGQRNKVYDISGVAVSTTSSLLLPTIRLNLQALSGNSGSIITKIIPQTQVFFYTPEINDVAGRPFEFKFKIEAVEIK